MFCFVQSHGLVTIILSIHCERMKFENIGKNKQIIKNQNTRLTIVIYCWSSVKLSFNGKISQSIVLCQRADLSQNIQFITSAKMLNCRLMIMNILGQNIFWSFHLWILVKHFSESIHSKNNNLDQDKFSNFQIFKDNLSYLCANYLKKSSNKKTYLSRLILSSRKKTVVWFLV